MTTLSRTHVTKNLLKSDFIYDGNFRRTSETLRDLASQFILKHFFALIVRTI